MQERKSTSVILIVAAMTLFGFALTLPAQSGSGGSDRWEYRVLDTKDLLIHPALTDGQIDEAKRVGVTAARNLESEFDRLGAEGWDLVSFADRVAVFKRSRN